VNNYNAPEMAMQLNESVFKAAVEAQQEELSKKIEEVTQRLTIQFTSHWAKKEAVLEQKLAAERKAQQKELNKSQSNVHRI